jgi:hypothetical protein
LPDKGLAGGFTGRFPSLFGGPVALPAYAPFLNCEGRRPAFSGYPVRQKISFISNGLWMVIHAFHSNHPTTRCQGNNLKKFPAPGRILLAEGKGFESQRFC